MLTVVRSIIIAAPVPVVQSQFADVAHHQRTAHHRGTTFKVVSDNAKTCEYEQTTKIGPLRLLQKFRLQRNNAAEQVNELLAGAFSPGSITFTIVPTDDENATLVTAKLRSERAGIIRLLAPMLRLILGRAIRVALQEDQRDLESGNYAHERTSQQT